MHTMVSSNLEMLLINEIEKRQFKNRLMSNLEKQINTVLELRAKRRVPTRKSSKMELLIQAEKKKHTSALKYFCEKYK